MRTKLTLLFLAFSITCYGQVKLKNAKIQNAKIGQVATSSGYTGPALVNHGGQQTGGVTYASTWSLTAGNTVLVWVYNNSTGTMSLGDDHGNTYTKDITVPGKGGASMQGVLFRCSNFSGSGTFNFTVTGAANQVSILAVEITGNRTLAAASTSNPVGTSDTVAPAAPGTLTTTDGNIFILDMFGDDTGGASSANQVDGTFTTLDAQGNGGSFFVGGTGYKTSAASGTFTDGWSDAVNNTWVAALAAYK